MVSSSVSGLNYFSIISFAGLLCPMGNPWFQEGSQSLLQLSSTGAYTVLWNLDIRSRSAKQWINFKLKMLHFVWEQQNQCLIQTYMGNLWYLFTLEYQINVQQILFNFWVLAHLHDYFVLHNSTEKNVVHNLFFTTYLLPTRLFGLHVYSVP